MTKAMDATRRLTALRNAGVPLILTGHAAWHLSGGVLGARDDHEGTVPLARIARDVPDAEHFLPDWREATRPPRQPTGGPPWR